LEGFNSGIKGLILLFKILVISKALQQEFKIPVKTLTNNCTRHLKPWHSKVRTCQELLLNSLSNTHNGKKARFFHPNQKVSDKMQHSRETDINTYPDHKMIKAGILQKYWYFCYAQSEETTSTLLSGWLTYGSSIVTAGVWQIRNTEYFITTTSHHHALHIITLLPTPLLPLNYENKPINQPINTIGQTPSSVVLSWARNSPS